MGSLRKSLGRLRRTIWPGQIVRPTLVVIGAQKAGTTPLAHYLGQHPRVLRASEKEIDYFGSETRLPLGESFYHSHFRYLSIPRDPMTFDASPHYLGTENAARDIHAYDSKCRIICLLREPAGRAFSAYTMFRRFLESDPNFFDQWNTRYYSPESMKRFVRRPPEHAKDFTLAVKEEIRSHSEGFEYEWRLLDYGLYAQRLAPFRERFPESQLLLMDSAALRGDTAAAMETITEFLGLAPFDWDAADTGQRHAERYRQEMPAEAAEALQTFYAGPNRELQKLTGIGATW